MSLVYSTEFQCSKCWNHSVIQIPLAYLVQYMQIFASKSKRVSVETINIGITSEVYNVDLRTFFKSKLCNDSK